VTRLQEAGGMAALIQGVGLISLLVIFFGVLPARGMSVADLADPAKALPLASGQPLLLLWLTIIAGVLADTLTLLLVLGLHDRLRSNSPALSRVFMTFGFLSYFLFIATGLLNYTGVRELAAIYPGNVAGASSAYFALNGAIDALRNGGSFAAGLWVFLLSFAALRGGGLPRALGYYGALAGVLNVAA
jgi:hypothetical protein